MKFTWAMAGVCALVLTACGKEPASVSTSQASEPVAASVSKNQPVAASAVVADLPKSCAQLLATIEKCVVKYEGSDPAEALAFRMEFEQLKGQITSNTDVQGLDQACTESNRQSEKMPEMQC